MIKQINNKEYYDFMLLYNQVNFLHTNEYNQAREKMGWKCEFLGYFKDNKLVCAFDLHSKKLPKINRYLFYIPKGMIIDYNNLELLNEFSQELKKYLKNKKAYCVKIDPELDELVDGKINPIIDELKKMGYKHLGLETSFKGTQPRCSIINNLDNYENVYKNYDRRCKKFVENAIDCGIEIKKGTINDLDEFMEIMNHTATRGGYIARSREYFEILFESFGKHLELYFAEFNPKSEKIKNLDQKQKQLTNEKEEILKNNQPTKKQIAKLKNLDLQIKKNEKNLEIIKNACEKYPGGIKLSAAIYIKYEDKAWYWFGGSLTELREINPVYALMDFYIKKCIDEGIKSFDFLGISGNFDPNDPNIGLYNFKKKFGGNVVKYIGEFDLIIDQKTYILASKILPIVQSSKNSKVLTKLLNFINKN